MYGSPAAENRLEYWIGDGWGTDFFLFYLQKYNDFTCSLNIINYTEMKNFPLEKEKKASMPSFLLWGLGWLPQSMGGWEFYVLTKPRWTKALFHTCCLAIVEFNTIEIALLQITHNFSGRFCRLVTFDLGFDGVYFVCFWFLGFYIIISRVRGD